MIMVKKKLTLSRVIREFFLILLLVNSCKNLNSDAEKMLTFLPNENSPRILSAVPGMGDKGLPRNQKISILFDRPMNINSCVQSFSVSPSTPGFFDLTDYSLTFTPTTQWNFGTFSYTLTKNCESKEGNDLKELFSASFTVGEVSVAGSFPEVTNVMIATGSFSECNTGEFTLKNILANQLANVCMGASAVNQITFHFSRSMDKAVTPSAIVFSPSFSYNIQWVSDTTLRIIPDSPFPYQQRIQFNISSQAQDTQGVKMQVPITGSFYVGTGNLLPTLSSLVVSADTLSNCFNGTSVTADLVQSSISNVCLGIPNRKPFVFSFTRGMNRVQTQASINFSPNLIGTYTWSADDKTLTFLPDAPLIYGVRYTITIGNGAVSSDRIAIYSPSIYSFTAGGPLEAAPTVQAVGLVSQACANSLPGTGNASGGNWLSPHCFWDNSLSILGPSSYQFRAGDNGTGNINITSSCSDVNTDNFRLIFSNYMDLNSTINAIRLRRLSPPSTVIQLSSWVWSDCQTNFPFGCRVVDLLFSELEASCNGPSAFGNANTLGDFNLLRSDNTPAGYPYYMLTVDTTAKDVQNIPFSSNFQFSMEAK